MTRAAIRAPLFRQKVHLTGLLNREITQYGMPYYRWNTSCVLTPFFDMYLLLCRLSHYPQGCGFVFFDGQACMWGFVELLRRGASGGKSRFAPIVYQATCITSVHLGARNDRRNMPPHGGRGHIPRRQGGYMRAESDRGNMQFQEEVVDIYLAGDPKGCDIYEEPETKCPQVRKGTTSRGDTIRYQNNEGNVGQ